MSNDFHLVDRGWSVVLDDALKLGHSKLRVVCPFIKKPVAERLMKYENMQHIQVITRFNLSDFCDGVSDTAALRFLLERGAQIRGVRNLHAKLYLFGENRAVVTSANLTEAALLRNHEFGFVADNTGIVACCSEYFDNLWLKAGNNLAIMQLDEWDKKLEAHLASGARASQRGNLGDEGVNADDTIPPVVTPPRVAEARQAYVKFFGISSDRASLDLPVIDEVKRAGCHWACTYPNGKRPRQVQDGAIMFMARLVKEPNDIIIFGRAVAMKHVPGRDDATAKDIALRNFKKDWPHYVRVHHAEFIAGKMDNGISLNKLMEDLQANSFSSTKRNTAKGNGNMDPRKAYMQQAAVELTSDGFAWLNEKLEKAFTRHGQLAQTELEQLDWP
jgi:hypothetical protein